MARPILGSFEEMLVDDFHEPQVLCALADPCGPAVFVAGDDHVYGRWILGYHNGYVLRTEAVHTIWVRLELKWVSLESDLPSLSYLPK